MKPKREPLDRVDAEMLREMTKGIAWRLYRGRLERELQRQTEALVREQPETQTAMIRGKIDGLRTALRIPDILIKEASAVPAKSSKEEAA